MSDIGFNTTLNDEVSPSTHYVFTSCNECIQSLGEYCWCWEAKEGDYLQVFVIVLIIIFMYLASYCLGYARSSVTIGGISEINGFCSFDMKKLSNIRSDIGDISSKYNEESSVSGIPIPLYLIFNAILSGIYFAIKLIIFLADSPHYLSTINNDFDHLPWTDFYDARIILLATIYCHSLIMPYQNMSVYKEARNQYKGSCINIIFILCTLIMFIDFIGSIILMCIKYPLIITSLYHGGIGILGLIGISLTLCCLFPLIVCYAKVTTLIFTLFVCGSPIEEPCGRFIRGISNGFVLLSINYLYISSILCLCFLFIGGPNYSVIYLNLNDNTTDMLLIWLYVVATCIGCIGFIIGAANTTYKQFNDISLRSSKRSNNGYHHPRNNNTTEFIEV